VVVEELGTAETVPVVLLVQPDKVHLVGLEFLAIGLVAAEVVQGPLVLTEVPV
jgi:hypothetical protein